IRREAAKAKEAAELSAKAKVQADADLMAAQSAELAEAKAKKGFPLWRTLAVIVVALLVAEFVDKNIYNFTGTGPTAAPNGSS
ncbi:MAG: hypothetical protein ABJJ48_09575, partial [Marinomonas sp.]